MSRRHLPQIAERPHRVIAEVMRITARSPRLTRLWRQASGSVAPLFGLMAGGVFLMIGAAVDYGRWHDARAITISAADAAVLAGARALQTNASQDAALAIARKYYAEAVKARVPVQSDSINFVITSNGTNVDTTGNAVVSTPFMKFAGVSDLPVYRTSGEDYSKAVLAVGANAETSLETSLILDISGSMAGQKVTDLKAAANDLIDIVVWADQSRFTSKVALVPYAVAVNAGPYAAQARGNVSSGTCTTPGCEYYRFFNPSSDRRTFAISTCVSERTGDEAYTDASPSIAAVGRVYPSSANPCVQNAVVPLSNNKTFLTDEINALEATGSTGGQAGVAWGWYTLSPNWNGVWPSGSRPLPYSDLTTLNSKGKPKLRKIAVLMTDGEYNSPYCRGVIAANATTGSGATSDHINCIATNGSAYSQARTMCGEMKTAGIEVYAIGFLVVDSQDARDLLSECASDASHYYISTDGEELKQAFRDIALKMSAVYLVR